ncbi:hypothetical protein AYR62_08735 [Secundilactobacillus paracollinoides]|uniref:Uncharacterized protein n=1 Tax=Secundilactobacillus paracollinoides TaxID=240427 RepID=A0A1B2IZ89_9LACO|nr:KxYKxGKxW signal peptide domain-containing protein [Secundilactobacillus paracollinoides]ANZ61455.1 hypothetical protein AYR61_08895 [Secundilactobacillus paracollinoides]ANZ64156.1 hypothetical protein AYR62_08735 [Secundilactobacillus paracollinoides]ANZ67376.1 hypothetical protein AYR63_09645 [Secundilactobacillus paracollinoides]KRL77435.1 hypothetical protein FC17_GL001260 [Secundilactobacillus paracollinoides DSM 15502 = JCM 11969]
MKKTMEKAHQKMLQDTSEEKYRVKLYKAGRLWLAAGMMTLAFGLVSVTGQVRVSADDTTPTTNTESSAASDQSSSATDSDSSTDSASSASPSATDSSQTDTTSTESSTGEAASETQTSAAETTETGTTTKDASKKTTDTAKTATADSSSAITASVTTDEKTADESTAADATTGAKTVTDRSTSPTGTTDNDASNAEVTPESTATTLNPDQSQTVNETDLGVADDTAVSAAKQIASDTYTTTGVAQVVTAQLTAAEDTDTNDADGTDDAANTGVITTQNGVEYQGFSVTDPTYPDGVKTIPNSDDYLYTEIAYGTVGNYTSYVALSTDRATASQTNVTVMDADGNVVSTTALTDSATSVPITADGASGLSITDNQDTLFN